MDADRRSSAATSSPQSAANMLRPRQASGESGAAKLGGDPGCTLRRHPTHIFPSHSGFGSVRAIERLASGEMRHFGPWSRFVLAPHDRCCPRASLGGSVGADAAQISSPRSMT